jgi:hypothetical protein
MARPRETCQRCGKIITSRTVCSGGGPIAHKCPHGVQCVWQGWTKLRPTEECSVCAAERAEREARRPMKVALQPTAQLARFEGTTNARVWQGVTEQGIEVLAVVLCVAQPRVTLGQVGRLGPQIRETLLPEPDDEIWFDGLSYPNNPGTSPHLDGDVIRTTSKVDP